MNRPSIIITAHCSVRARQRGYQPTDLAIMERLGTAAGDGILLRKRDVEYEIETLSRQLRRIRRRKAHQRLYQNDGKTGEYEIIQQINRLQRLSGAFVPVKHGHALSSYRPCMRRLKHLLRGGRRVRSDRRYRR
jgi:hypothetical protein